MRLISFKLPDGSTGLLFTDNVKDWTELKADYPIIAVENTCLAILEGVDLHHTQVPVDTILCEYSLVEQSYIKGIEDQIKGEADE